MSTFIIQNRHLIQGREVGDLNFGEWCKFMDEFNALCKGFGYEDQYEISILDDNKKRFFPEDEPKFRSQSRMTLEDGLIWSGNSYIPIAWIRESGQWVPFEFMNIVNGQEWMDNLNYDYLKKAKQFIEKVGEKLDQYNLKDWVVFKHWHPKNMTAERRCSLHEILSE